MLFVKRTMLLFMLCSSTAAIHAQQINPAVAVFSSYSPSIDLSESVLSNAINISKGQQADLQFGNNFNFSGTVISNEQVYSNLQTMMIRSAAYNNALLQISRLVNKDNSISYAGRIFSPGSADGYEIKRTADGNYHLQKFETARILEVCHQL
jgi:hypothetical protein